MVNQYKDYQIEVINDPEYTFKSADNSHSYRFEYDESGIYNGSRHGIRIDKDEVELSSAIVSACAGSTTIHEDSFLLIDDKIFICCADHIFALNIPELKLVWKLKADEATCFAIYPFKGDLLLHGELTISRIDLNGNIKWQFGPRDIFLTLNGESSFEIIEDHIYLKDFEYHIYILDENGKEIDRKK